MRGWADRLAQNVAESEALEIHYANLAVRGSVAAQVRDEQLPVALALEPDLASVVVGVNDLLRPRFDLNETLWNVESAWAHLRAVGATVLSFTFPDITSSMVLPPHFARRLAALNDAIRIAAARHGVLVVDLATEPAALRPGSWAPDRLHANEIGQDRIAAAMAHLLGLPGAVDTWSVRRHQFRRRVWSAELAATWPGPAGRCCLGCSGSRRAATSVSTGRPSTPNSSGSHQPRRAPWPPDARTRRSGQFRTRSRGGAGLRSAGPCRLCVDGNSVSQPVQYQLHHGVAVAVAHRQV